MLKKYLPDGRIWEAKLIKDTNLYKICSALDNYFLDFKKNLKNKFKIFNESNLDSWLIWLKIPDSVFSLEFVNNLENIRDIKLNRKYNNLLGFVDFCDKLNIEYEIVQNSDLIFSVKVRAKQDFVLEDASFFEMDLESNLTGDNVIYNNYIIDLVEKYLLKITIATCEVVVELKE